MSDFTYMRYIKQSNSQRQEVEQWFSGLGAGSNRELVFQGYKILVWEGEKFLEMNGGYGWWRWLHNRVNVLNATELYP